LSLQESYNKSISILNPLFEKHYGESLSARDKKDSDEEDGDNRETTNVTEGNVQKQQYSKTSWRWQSFAAPESCAVFHPGIVDLSPGWFMNRREVSTPIFLCICHD